MLEGIGFDFAVTFIFVFGVVYGLLVLADVFGKGQKRVNGIIAIAFALFAASYAPFVEFIASIMPYATAVLIVLFFLAFVKLLIFGRGKKDSGKKRDPVSIIILLFVIVVFLAAAGSSGILANYLPNLPYTDINNILWSAGLLLAAGILYYAYEYSKGNGEEEKK